MKTKLSQKYLHHVPSKYTSVCRDVAVRRVGCSKVSDHPNKHFGHKFRVDGSSFCFPHLESCQTRYLYQYNETNVMQFSSSLLRIKGLNMFRALPAHPQEALNKRHLVYCMRIMSVDCDGAVARLQFHCNRATAPSKHEQAMLETCRGPWFSVNWMKSALRWFHCTDIIGCTVSKPVSPLPITVSLYWHNMMHGQQNSKPATYNCLIVLT
jgi:hypothetical protein